MRITRRQALAAIGGVALTSPLAAAQGSPSSTNEEIVQASNKASKLIYDGIQPHFMSPRISNYKLCEEKYQKDPERIDRIVDYVASKFAFPSMGRTVPSGQFVPQNFFAIRELLVKGDLFLSGRKCSAFKTFPNLNMKTTHQTYRIEFEGDVVEFQSAADRSSFQAPHIGGH